MRKLAYILAGGILALSLSGTAEARGHGQVRVYIGVSPGYYSTPYYPYYTSPSYPAYYYPHRYHPHYYYPHRYHNERHYRHHRRW